MTTPNPNLNSNSDTTPHPHPHTHPKPQHITNNIKLIPLSQLKRSDYNPRNITDKARSGLQNSIQEFGLVQPIIYNKQTNNIVGGHQRLSALLSTNPNLTHIECIEVDLPLIKEKALNIALNSNSISGEYNQHLLTDLLTELQTSTDVSIPTNLFNDLNFDDLLPNFNDSHQDQDQDTNSNNQQSSQTEKLPEDYPSTYINIQIQHQASFISEELINIINSAIQHHFPEHRNNIKITSK